MRKQAAQSVKWWGGGGTLSSSLSPKPEITHPSNVPRLLFLFEKGGLKDFLLCLWEGCDAERQTKENFKSLNTLGAQKANTAPVPGTRLWPARNNFTPAQRKVRSYAPPGPSVLCGKGQPRGTQTTLSSAGARPPGAAPGGKAPARSLAARRCTVQGAAGGHSRRGGPFPPPHLSGTWVAALRVTWSPPSSPVLRVVGDLRTSFAARAELQPVLGEMLSSCGARLRALRARCRDASAPARNPRPALVSSGRGAGGACAGRPTGTAPPRADAST